MDLAELKQYVRVVRDGENAKYMIEQAILQLKQTCADLRANPPLKKVEENPDSPRYQEWSWRDSREATRGISIVTAIGLIIWAGIDYFSGVHDVMDGIGRGIIFFFGAALVLSIFFFVSNLVYALIHHIIKSAETDAENKRIQNEYDNKVKETQNRNAMYARIHREQVEANNQAIATIEKSIGEYEAKKRSIEDDLRAVYARNVLHPNVRNQIAVDAIFNYLDMGICTRLEGQDGAYHLYMDDLNAQKICNSIDTLRRTVEKGFQGVSQMQRSLAFVMQNCIQETQKMNRNICAEINSMQSELSRQTNAQMAAAAQQSGQLDALNRSIKKGVQPHLSNIEHYAETIADNQYLTMSGTNLGYYRHKP